jgi:cold shock CspA family protein
MAYGYVTYFNHSRGFGFIKCDDGSDLFCHIRNVFSLGENLEQDMPQVGDRLEFEVGINKKNEKPEAKKVFIRHRAKERSNELQTG